MLAMENGSSCRLAAPKIASKIDTNGFHHRPSEACALRGQSVRSAGTK
jgi:hypothetical protein